MVRKLQKTSSRSWNLRSRRPGRRLSRDCLLLLAAASLVDFAICIWLFLIKHKENRNQFIWILSSCHEFFFSPLFFFLICVYPSSGAVTQDSLLWLCSLRRSETAGLFFVGNWKSTSWQPAGWSSVHLLKKPVQVRSSCSLPQLWLVDPLSAASLESGVSAVLGWKSQKLVKRGKYQYFTQRITWPFCRFHRHDLVCFSLL